MNENSNQTMTVRDAVENVIKDLNGIAVPISQMETIGFPIARSIDTLKNVCAAWDAEEKEKQKAQQEVQEEPEIKLELVPEKDQKGDA